MINVNTHYVPIAYNKVYFLINHAFCEGDVFLGKMNWQV